MRIKIFLAFYLKFSLIIHLKSEVIDPLSYPHYQNVISKKAVNNSAISIRDGRIIGGTAAALGQFDYHVLLYGYYRTALCGASLIRYNWVLTVAHCVYDMKNIELHFGTVNRTASPTMIIKIKDESQIIIHEDYDNNWLYHDIALIYLKDVTKSILDSPYIGTIELPSPQNLQYNENGIICGFGLTRDGGSASLLLKFINLPLITAEECSEYFYIDETNICIDTEIGEAPCQGDSGGALQVTTSDGIRTIEGVLSFGHILCTVKYPVVFTRVSHYLTWIHDKFSEYEEPDESTEDGTTQQITTTSNGARNLRTKVEFVIILWILFLLN